MLIIFLLSPIFAVNIYPFYCINDSKIYAKDLGFFDKDQEIYDLESKTSVKISSKKIKEIVGDFEDKSGGFVAFVKNCSPSDQLQESFLKNFSLNFEDFKIENLKIKSQNDYYKNFKFIDVSFPKNFKNNGIFLANFLNKDQKISIYFNYKIDFKVKTLRAIKNINANHILNALDYNIKYENYRDNLLKERDLKLISRRNIKSGEILYKRDFKTSFLINKGDDIEAILREDQLTLSVKARALNNGNIGDVIKVKTKENKIFNAIIFAKRKVVVK